MIEDSIPTTLFEATRFLLQKNSSRSEEDQDVLITTLFAAAEYHGNQKRISGMPYIIHPIEVACFLTLTSADLPTIQAGILHDVLEDTETQPDEIRRRFGSEVYTLLEAVTKQKMFSRKEFLEKVYTKAKKDPRIAWIKLADQCANHRNQDQLLFSPQKHLEHIQEQEEFYIPKLLSIPGLPKDLVSTYTRISNQSHEAYLTRKK